MILQRLGTVLAVFLKMQHVVWQMVYGAWRISALQKPIVTIFGSAKVALQDRYATQAHHLAQQFVEHEISVLTGGGAGIMQAASCGAIQGGGHKAKAMGIGVKQLGEGRNPCVQEYFELDYFFARKRLLIRYSQAFIVFPGGFGTLDELAEVLTLIQTQKMPPMPIILVGREYWQSFVDWIIAETLQHGLIVPEHTRLFTVTDDLDEVVRLVCVACSHVNKK